MAYKLKEIHRAFLVKEFACFAGPKEAVQGLMDKFGIEISEQGAQHYDPSMKQGQRLGKKWKELFRVVRAAFIDDVVETVPESIKSVRIRRLAEASRRYGEHGNYLAMAKMLEQIAKEVGNVHTNRHEFTGRDGGAIKFEDVSAMTDEQIDAELKQIFGKNDIDVHPASETKQ